MKVTMPYIGQVLSVNSYKLTIGKRRTSRTRTEVTVWMWELADAVAGCKFIPPITVKIFGKFRDGRVPDLDNLHKVIGDALKVGLGIDDRHFIFVDLGYETGYLDPAIEIDIEGGNNGLPIN